MEQKDKSLQARLKRKRRVRKKVFGVTERPRLSVYKSLRYIYAQIVDDIQRKTLVAASSLTAELKGKLKSTANMAAARAVGETIAKRALEQKIAKVVFDKNQFKYHGKIKALADAAREAGLQF